MFDLTIVPLFYTFDCIEVWKDTVLNKLFYGFRQWHCAIDVHVFSVW